MKRLNSSPYDITINDRPDVLPLAFAQLNLPELFKVQLVCKLWNQVSREDNTNWYRAAFEKGLYIDRFQPVRIQVLNSFKSYCEAARIIFPALNTIPSNLAPLIQKEMMDTRIAEMNKTEMDPLQSLAEHMQRQEDTIEESLCLVHSCMQMIPVWVETGLLTINQDLLLTIAHRTSAIRKLSYTFHNLSMEVKSDLANAIMSGKRQTLNGLASKMSSLEEIYQALNILHDYIFQFDDPSNEMLNAICQVSTTLPIIQRWHQVALVCCDNDKKGLLFPLIKKPDWKHQCEQFMLKEGIDVHADLPLPTFFQDILTKVDESQFQTLINTYSATEYRKDKREQYISDLTNKMVKHTLISIRDNDTSTQPY